MKIEFADSVPVEHRQHLSDEIHSDAAQAEWDVDTLLFHTADPFGDIGGPYAVLPRDGGLLVEKTEWVDL